ncbi:MAG: hypothetical protein L0099_12385, partial [Acidobacteria bacterium]|nr:hypothetical protein [Acidobacteriota bacterium]
MLRKLLLRGVREEAAEVLVVHVRRAGDVLLPLLLVMLAERRPQPVERVDLRTVPHVRARALDLRHQLL